MRLTIIPSDKTVYVDSVAYGDIDLSWLPPIDGKTIHAVQWYGDQGEGEVEFVGPHQNLKITSLGVENVCSFERAVEQWNVRREEEEAIIQARLEEEERLKKEEEEMLQAQFLFEFNKTHLPTAGEEEVDDEEEDLFYDIEELLKEI
jgi:hypothetical protein